jgi:uncharacterized protein Usg
MHRVVMSEVGSGSRPESGQTVRSFWREQGDVRPDTGHHSADDALSMEIIMAAINLVEGTKASEDFRKQVLGYGLTTAEILYRMPDHPALLQSYVWQNYDLFPKFPALKDFLTFWQRSLDGPLFSVTVAHSKLVKPAELRAIDGVFRLH